MKQGGSALIIGIGKPKPGGPPPPPAGMKDIPGQMGMRDDKPEGIEPEEPEEAEPKTADEILAAICDMCRKYEEAKTSESDDEGEIEPDADEHDDSGYGPTE